MSWFFTLPWDVITREAKLFNLDKLLVGAIVQTESSGSKNATRYEANYRWLYEPMELAEQRGTSVEKEIEGQRTSYGYMQVMGAVCREYLYDGAFDDLLSDLSLRYGCRHFAALLKRYGLIHDAVAAYNAGSPRKRGAGYENQVYVDRVMSYYAQLARAAKT